MQNKDKTQLLRHIFIDQKIREGMASGQYANCASMAQEYEVSTKSIMRDIDYLKNQCDVPIAYDSSKKGYFYSEKNFKMPAININAGDLFAITIAEKVLKQHQNTPIYQKLKSVFKRIEESLPEKVSIHPAWINNKITVIEGHTTRIIPEVWAITAEALQRGRTLSVLYRKPNEEPEWSRIDPYHLVNFQGEWYLIGHCHLRKRLLTFAVSRIKEAKILTSGFQIPADFDFKEFSSQRFGIFSGKESYRVKIFFPREQAPYILEREWHPSQKISKNDNGSLIFELTTNHLLEIKQWVLSWGAGAEVLEPEKLRLEIKKELSKALDRYKVQDKR